MKSSEFHFRGDSRLPAHLEKLAYEVIGAAIEVHGTLIVELKTVEQLTAVHVSQALVYLKLTKLQLALLINFNTAILRDGIKRVINS